MIKVVSQKHLESEGVMPLRITIKKPFTAE